MKTTLKKRLLDALNACQAIQEFTAQRTFAEYEANQMLRSAVERQFEILGEALNQALAEDSTLAVRIPDARRIVGMRNRIIHGYDSVDDELLWQTVHAQVGQLTKHLAELLASEASDSAE